MNRSITLIGSVIVTALGAAIYANAGNLNPPPGPVGPTGPSLTDLQSDINNIMPGGGGANIGEITDVVVGASMGINDNIDDLTPRGESLYNVKMRVDGLNGTSLQSGYTSFIDIDAAEIFTAVVLDSGPGMNNPGAPMISSVKIISSDGADNNMALIFQQLTMGTNVSMDVVFVQTSGQSPIEFMRISFDQSFITAFELTETGYELEITPIACVTLTIRQLNQMGQADPPFTRSWDVQTNQVCN